MDGWQVEAPGDQAQWVPWLNQLAEDAEAGRLPIVHRHRNLLVVVQAPDGRSMVAKRWRKGPLARLLAVGRPGKAERSYRVAQQLIHLGLPTPPPLLWAQRRLAKGMVESWFCCEARNAAPTLYSWTHDQHHPAAQACPAWPTVLYRAGALVARLHQAGVEHRDLTPGNIILSDHGLELVDLNRVRFHAQALPEPLAAANVAQIGSPQHIRDRLLVHGYAQALGAQVEPWWQAYRAARARWDRRWRFKDGTRPLRHALRDRLRHC